LTYTKIKDARVHCAVLKLRAVPVGFPCWPLRWSGSSKVLRDRFASGAPARPAPLHRVRGWVPCTRSLRTQQCAM